MTSWAFWARVDRSGSCWIWTGARFTNGYGSSGRKGRHKYAHRQSWEMINGPIPHGKLVLHHCDVRNCVNPEHLYLGSHADNMRDCMERKRHQKYVKPWTVLRGEECGPSKLTEADVIAIRADDGKQRDIAKQYGISQYNVWSIKHRKTWRHV